MMYLLNLWLKQKYPIKDYENAVIDPDIAEVKRKKLLKDARDLLRENHMIKILNNISCNEKKTDI